MTLRRVAQKWWAHATMKKTLKLTTTSMIVVVCLIVFNLSVVKWIPYVDSKQSNSLSLETHLFQRRANQSRFREVKRKLQVLEDTQQMVGKLKDSGRAVKILSALLEKDDVTRDERILDKENETNQPVPNIPSESNADQFAHGLEVADEIVETHDGDKGNFGDEVVSEFLSGIDGNISRDDNRLLYKLYQAELNPKARCVIRILKYHLINKELQKDWQAFRCNFTSCTIYIKISTDYRDMAASDVVIMTRGPYKIYNWDELWKVRPPGQLWGLYSKESPTHEPQFVPPAEMTDLANPFNLSMTYLSDSDITFAYMDYVEKNITDVQPIPAKSKLMAWMASNCEEDYLKWNRTGFVKTLQKYLPVDIYGKCGDLDCPRTPKNACPNIMRQYKFYLALENSNCPEYITEKFSYNGLRRGLVPIVYGASPDDFRRLAPKHSYIHLEDFSTMEEFVGFIKRLDKDQKLYEEYFEWRKTTSLVTGKGEGYFYNSDHLCHLLQKFVHLSLHPETSWQHKNPSFEKYWNRCSKKSHLLGVPV